MWRLYLWRGSSVIVKAWTLELDFLPLNPGSLLIGCVILNKLLNFSVPQFPLSTENKRSNQGIRMKTKQINICRVVKNSAWPIVNLYIFP